MALDVIGLGLANSYTDEEVAGGGAIKGKNAVVDDISKSGKKNTVRFKWTLDNGTVLTGNMEVLDGEDGAPGAPGQQGKDGKDGKDGADGDPGPAGKGIKSIAQVSGESKIIITYDDDTTSDPIDIPTVAGKDGKDGTDGQDGQDGVGVPVGGTAGQVLAKKTNDNYDTEWVNAGGGGSHIYSTDEHVVGTWVDGKPVYEKTYVIQSAVTLAINTYTTVINDPPENVDNLIDIALSASIRSFVYWNYASIGQFTSNTSGLNTLAAGTSFTYRYTKTTD